MQLKHIALSAILAAGVIATPLYANSTDSVLTARTFVDVAKKVLPSVVSIDVTVPVSKRLQNDYGVDNAEELFRKFWLDQEENGGSGMTWRDFNKYNPEDFGFRGSGSGVIVHEQDGWAYVLTNLHVVETDPRPHINAVDENAEFTVTLDSSFDVTKQRIEPDRVELVGFDELTDIAVLRFRPAEDMHFNTVVFADSDKVDIGEWVLALGNPLELNNSVSQGIISAKNRTLGTGNRIESLLQTTAVINPGNSGGPLVNLDGEIVGINNAIVTQTGRWAGIGFAIPANHARYAAEEIINKGSVSRGYLGVSMVDVDDIRSTVYERSLARGVSVEDVRPNTPAAAAGLTKGDVILSVDDNMVADSQGLLSAIAGRRSGDQVRLKVRRFENDSDMNGRDMSIVVTLGERPSEQALNQERRNEELSNAIEKETRALGLKLEPASEGNFTGVRVTKIDRGSVADRAGLRVGDLIIQINGIDITSANEMGNALGNVNTNIGHVIVFRRDGSNQTVTLSVR